MSKERDRRAPKGDEIPKIQSEVSLQLPHDPPRQCFSCDDPNSTNIFVSNLAPSLRELDVMRIFGAYGSLASVKIMYPRTDEEHSRGTNCGFVAFMLRKDAESAINALNGTEQHGLKIRTGWGKSISLPKAPLCIPNDVSLKNNVFLPLGARSKLPNSTTLSKIGAAFGGQSTITVTMPSDSTTIATIHRTIEYVIREGPEFEELLIQEKTNDLNLNFLWEYDSVEHIYYRWKLFSILNGDSVFSWKIEPFVMFAGGRLWIPPALPVLTTALGSADESYDKDARSEFRNTQCAKFEVSLFRCEERGTAIRQ
ncbi:hypothetical protein ACOME3_009628 [Neoechinorhynchus agilis]